MRKVAIIKKRILTPLLLIFFFPVCILAQNVTVSGHVTDELGEPIIGASVKVPGSSVGSITDLDGYYSITLPKGKQLEVSYVGYKSYTFISKDGTVDVRLQESANELNEVVAIGYGTVKRKDVTGSVASVGNADLVAVPVASPVEAMQGKLAGVRVTMPEGNPDAEVVIRVRGGGSITRDNSPLYIVDGFPVSSISDIPTSDIESIDVLKDASSTAIYGSRGSNGIVLVTTKSGKAGKVTVNYNAYYGFKKAEGKVDVLGLEDYLKWQYELSYLTTGANAGMYQRVLGGWNDIPRIVSSMQTKDWQDEIYGRTGNVTNHSINVTGGSEKLRFTAGYNYIAEKAILLTSNYYRNNLNLKLNYEPNEKTKLEFSTRYSRTKVNGDGQSDANGDQNSSPSNSFGRIRHAIVQSPLVGSGSLLFDESNIDDGLEDPVTALNDNYKRRVRENFTFNGAFTWNILQQLVFRTDIGLDIYNNDFQYFIGSTTYESQNNTLAEYKNMPLTSHTVVNRRTIRNSNTLQYDFSQVLPRQHSLNLMVGQESLATSEILHLTRIEGFPSFYDANMAFHLSAQGHPTRANDFYFPDDKMVSFFGRANYSLLDRYLLTATLRADGSSKFSKHNRWGYFPSLAAGWRIIEEPWMRHADKWLSNLKLRVSYGVSGNNNIPSGQTQRSYSITQSSWLSLQNSWLSAGNTMSNPNLKWETTHSLNLGIDFGFFNNKLNGSFEIYKNNVKDLLMEMQITGSGYITQYQNVGETENSGVELTLNYAAVNKKNYGLNFSFTFGHNTNKVVSLGGMESYTKDSYWASTEVGSDYLVKPGKPVGTIIGYKLAGSGRYETDDFEGYKDGKWTLKPGVADASGIVGTVRPGTMKLQDKDGSGVINEDDKFEIGDANAWAVGGFSIGARIHGFDFNADFSYSIGNDVYNADKIDQTSTRGGIWRNLSTRMSSGKRWTNVDEQGNFVNDADKLAQMNSTTTMWSPYTTKAVLTDWAIEDGSFLRLSTLTIGYTFPKRLISRIFIRDLRLYFTASNLFCITKYSGQDPEADCCRAFLVCPGVDFSAYPRSRQFVFGVNLSF